MIRLIVLITLIISCCYGNAQKSTLLNTVLQQKTFATLTGDSIVIANNSANTYTLIDYYFAGCKPCNANLPKLEKLKRKFGSKLNIVAINPVDTKPTVITHQLKYNLQHTIIWGNDAIASKAYFGLPEYPFGYPFYLLISPDGKLIFESMNSLTWHKKIAQLIR
jgi:thiol-disulfide isomerase/thioredoxin